jgi:hypothetical protein
MATAGKPSPFRRPRRRFDWMDISREAAIQTKLAECPLGLVLALMK